MTMPRTEVAPPPVSTGGGRHRRIVIALLAPAAAALAVGITAVAIRGPANYLSAGFSFPQWPTVVGAAALRIGADLCGSVTVGALVFAVLCTRPSMRGRLGVDGYGALTVARRAAPVWAAAAVLLTPVSAANTVGQPVLVLLGSGHMPAVITQTLPSRGWLVAAVIAIVVAVAARSVLTVSGAVGLALLAGLALLPPAVVGNAGEGLGHDVDTTAIVLHVLAAAVWIGAAVAGLAESSRRRTVSIAMIRRLGWITVCCAAALAVSGFALADNMIAPGQLISTQYGGLAVAKAVALAVLAAAGVWAVRRVAQWAGSGDLRRVRWWLSGQLLLLAAAVGGSVAMAQQPAAAFLVEPTTPSSQQLGFTLPLPPGVRTLAVTWRFDLLLGTAAVVLAALYLAGVIRLRSRGVDWSAGRTVAFVSGCAVLLVASSSGVSAYAEATFSMHMAVHMIVNMVVPVLLVLGGPLSLLRACVPPRGPEGPPGPREYADWVVSSWPVRVLTNPFAAVTIDAALLFGLYLTPILGYVVGYHWFHELTTIAFLVSGYFLYWQIVGIDPLPRRIPHLARLGVVVILMPIDAIFGIAILTTQSVMGLVFYGYLALPWLADQVADQHLGAVIAWIGGEVPLLAVAVTLMIQWWRSGGPGRDGPGEADPVQAAWQDFVRRRAVRP